MEWKRFVGWLLDEGEDLQVVRSHNLFIQKQAKFLHGICLLCGWALSISHWSVAPIWATLVYPAIVTTLSLTRLYALWKSQQKPLEDWQLRRWRRKGSIVAAASMVLFSGWALILFPYGGPYLQIQAAFTVVIVNLISICSLIHFRSYAFSSAVLGSSLFYIYFPLVGGPGFIMFSFVGMVGSLSTFLLINNYYQEFVSLVHKQQELKQQAAELEIKQRETQRISDLHLHHANHDFMTELPNRRHFFTQLDEFWLATKKLDRDFSVLVFDLGGFKMINDIAGVAAGDRILLEIVERIRGKFPEESYIARMAGDEFAVIAHSDILGKEQAQSILHDIFDEPCQLDESALRLNYAAGMSFLDDTVEHKHQMLERALYALAAAKQKSNLHMAVFNDDMRHVMENKARISNALRTADLEEELFVVFQPIVNIETMNIGSVECLARWNSPVIGNVPPSDFIPAAEHAGQINKMTLILLEKALDAYRSWPEDLMMSFNLSASNLSSHGFVDQFLTTLKAHGFNPERMSCEITETSIMWDFEEACRAISLLKAAGIRLSLDDFGTGYSSLSHVHNLPLDCIKVDRSFVSGIHPDTAGYGIVKSLLTLSRDMEISCIVEGVETEQELEVLKGIGTCCVQGYLFSKPVPAEELTLLLKNGIASDCSDENVGIAQVS